MSQFLRDEFLKNLSLNEERLKKINEAVLDIANKANQLLNLQYNPQNAQVETHNINEKLLMPVYIIRFDNKGFRLFDFEKVMKYFQEAHRVERIIFMLDSIESVRSNKLFGKSTELRFDTKDLNNCYLVVQDDNDDWVNATFYKLKELLDKYRNNNYIIRNRWLPFIVQIFGVVIGFFISLWVAIKLSPKLSIDNALALTFIIVFLIFSNAWTVIFEGILRLRDYFWPNISFKESKGIHWLMKALISTLLVSFFIFMFSKLFAYIGGMLTSILK